MRSTPVGQKDTANQSVVSEGHGQVGQRQAWLALVVLLMGFFMVLVDQSIVAVATPNMMNDFHADYTQAVWITSAYLLAFSVPMLIAGRLGDSVGQRTMYIVGLTVFTVASVWCAQAGSIDQLITARVFQGLGAGLLTPQTMALVTRIFPVSLRSHALGWWGAVAGVATLVGPILGGFLVQHYGWESIFLINLPIGILAIVLAFLWIPVLPKHHRGYDWLGIVLSTLGLLLLVYGIQEGEASRWSLSTGITIAGGLVFLGCFVLWEMVMKGSPLIPPVLFRSRNFSLANLAIMTMGFAITGIMVPLMIYAQKIRLLEPQGAAMLLIPMAVISGIAAPLVGRRLGNRDTRWYAVFGYVTVCGSLLWLSLSMTSTSSTWQILLPLGLLGLGTAFVFSPTSTTATHGLRPEMAGAGSGVYNATRQFGSVIGAATLGALMHSRVTAEVAQAQAQGTSIESATATGLSQSILLAAGVILIGAIGAFFFQRPPLPSDGSMTERMKHRAEN